MLDIMEGMEDYNNMGALLGLDGSDNEELLGALRRMNPVARQKAINKLASPGAPSRGSRAEMEKHFGELPPNIKSALSRGELRLADTIIYSYKKVVSKSVKLFETQDVRTIGQFSLSGSKLPKNQALLVSGIVLLAGISVSANPDDVMSTSYDKIESFPALASGEFNIKANKKVIMPETSMYMFRTANDSSLPLGYYKLANPRLISDDVLIEATVELGTINGLNPNTYIFLGLHGTITTP